MHVKKIDDSRVDEIIKVAEKQSLPLHGEPQSYSPESAVNPRINARPAASSVLIFILLALTLLQSIELINLRSQIQKGQFSAEGAPAAPAGGNQGLPTQQGGC